VDARPPVFEPDVVTRCDQVLDDGLADGSAEDVAAHAGAMDQQHWSFLRGMLAADVDEVTNESISAAERNCPLAQRGLGTDRPVHAIGLAAAMMPSAKRSARAAMVRLGLAPTGPGITDPSAMYRRS